MVKEWLQRPNAWKLVLGPDGDTAAFSVTSDGQERLSFDDEIVPIVDGFARQHPDFSLDNAKGIIALTGYQGILGYRTNNSAAPEYASEKEQALKVVNRLKETGWSFACHGYGHLDAVKVSLARLLKDTKRWKAEVEPLVGPTDIYVFPYGSAPGPHDPKFQALLDAGFRTLYGVGCTGYWKVTPQYAFMDRINIDGISFHYQKSRLSEMFDVDSVIDRARPPLETDPARK